MFFLRLTHTACQYRRLKRSNLSCIDIVTDENVDKTRQNIIIEEKVYGAFFTTKAAGLFLLFGGNYCERLVLLRRTRHNQKNRNHGRHYNLYCNELYSAC